MSKRNRIFLSVILLFTLGVAALLYTVSSGLDIRYRESAEETLVDTAYIMAAWIETDANESLIDATRMNQVFNRVYNQRFTAKIYAITKHSVNLRVYVTDANGIVLYDSMGQDTGQDFRAWHDIHMALAGQYGARTTRTIAHDPKSDVMYVAAPIRDNNNQIIGAVSVGKTVSSQHELVTSAQQKLFNVGIITLAAFLIMLLVVTVWLASPTQLTHDIVQVFKQEKISHPINILRRLRTVLKSAFLDMRDAMAGRSYTEEYVQALTHELKSPLTAIRGAAELLREPMAETQKIRFAENINNQALRLQELADKLLELASLEKRHTLDETKAVDIGRLAHEVIRSLEPTAQRKKITLSLEVSDDITVMGDAFLLQRALTNLLANALDFSPENSTITTQIQAQGKQCLISIRDHGQGIPEYALDRVFEKFYSLRRPDSGQKSTGLGLPFVREIAHLHGGEIVLANHPQGGAVASLSLPSIKS
ncbi:MAG: two-component system sensor histidine kinase CreC [Methylophilus sp.]|nr:two-component system sensor histidine kinase CreC [Methylophilus sp.]